MDEVKEEAKPEKPKPKAYKFVEGKGLVEMEPEETVPPNRAERRRAMRVVRANMRRLTRKKPKKKVPAHAKKWNYAARRHLQRFVNVMEKKVQRYQEQKEKEAA